MGRGDGPAAVRTVRLKGVTRRATPGACGGRRCRGFSLLEVLVAFTILALSLGALYQVFGAGVTAARLGDEYTRAVLHAQSKLDALGVEDALEDGVARGRFDAVYGWQTTVARYPWPGGRAPRRARVAPYAVTVEVFWEDDARRRRVALTTLLLGPAS